jgi:hypothetical protein
MEQKKEEQFNLEESKRKPLSSFVQVNRFTAGWRFRPAAEKLA